MRFAADRSWLPFHAKQWFLESDIEFRWEARVRMADVRVVRWPYNPERRSPGASESQVNTRIFPIYSPTKRDFRARDHEQTPKFGRKVLSQTAFYPELLKLG